MSPTVKLMLMDPRTAPGECRIFALTIIIVWHNKRTLYTGSQGDLMQALSL